MSSLAFPSPDEGYSRENEAQFRAMVTRALRELSPLTVRTADPTIVDSPTLSAGENNDYALGADVVTVRTTPNAAGSSFTGFAGGSATRTIRVVNLGSADLTLKHQDASSAEANRIITPDATDWVLAATDVADLEYDDVTDRWRVAAIAITPDTLTLPRLSDLTIAVADDGTDDDYTVTWEPVDYDDTYTLDLWAFKNGVHRAATAEGSPQSVTSWTPTDAGEGDGVADTHWVVANLKDADGDVVWSMTAVCQSTI